MNIFIYNVSYLTLMFPPIKFDIYEKCSCFWAEMFTKNMPTLSNNVEMGENKKRNLIQNKYTGIYDLFLWNPNPVE